MKRLTWLWRRVLWITCKAPRDRAMLHNCDGSIKTHILLSGRNVFTTPSEYSQYFFKFHNKVPQSLAIQQSTVIHVHIENQEDSSSNDCYIRLEFKSPSHKGAAGLLRGIDFAPLKFHESATQLIARSEKFLTTAM